MALTVGTLISDAILEAYPFVSEYAIAKGPLVRQLERLDDKIVDFYFQNAPERLQASAAALPVVFATNATGYTLVAARSYLKFEWVSADQTLVVPITIRPTLSDSGNDPSAEIRGSKLFPHDQWNQRWATAGDRQYFVGDGDSIVYEYVPNSSTLTGLASTLTAPEETSEYIVHELALKIMLNSGTVTPERVQQAVAEIKDQWSGIVSNATKRTNSQSSFGIARD